jgi:putative sigma-54 modulation protein
MDVQKHEQRVDIVLRVNNLKIKSQAVSEDMYTSIDKAVHKIEAQLLRYKGKLQDHQARASAETDMQVDVIRSASDGELLELNDEIESESRRRLMDRYAPHKIVSKETRPLKTLTDGEAIMKLDLSGDAFLIYRSEETRNIKVIYRRKDGDFGVIVPKES